MTGPPSPPTAPRPAAHRPTYPDGYRFGPQATRSQLVLGLRAALADPGCDPALRGASVSGVHGQPYVDIRVAWRKDCAPLHAALRQWVDPELLRREPLLLDNSSACHVPRCAEAVLHVHEADVAALLRQALPALPADTSVVPVTVREPIARGARPGLWVDWADGPPRAAVAGLLAGRGFIDGDLVTDREGTRALRFFATRRLSPAALLAIVGSGSIAPSRLRSGLTRPHHPMWNAELPQASDAVAWRRLDTAARLAGLTDTAPAATAPDALSAYRAGVLGGLDRLAAFGRPGAMGTLLAAADAVLEQPTAAG